METNSGFSTNTLINALRSVLDHSKDKFSCDQIQEIMNLVTDLEYEVHLLQTNYTRVLKQSEEISEINQNLQELLQKLAASHLPTINEVSEDQDNEEASAAAVQDCNTADAIATSETSATLENGQDEMSVMAELISDLVVKKLHELDQHE